ncbi:MAG: FAD-dependent oxidoreductase [Anaerolineales bacterium]
MLDGFDVVVVGGGVFGAAGALELRQRGHQVLLIDPGPLPHPAASSTDISKVIRMDYGADVFYMRLMERAIDGWRHWNDLWERPLFHEVGFLLLTRSPISSGSFEGDSFETLKARGHQPERLDAAAIPGRFPAWAEGEYTDGYFNPEAGWAESGAVVAQLLAMGRQAGVEVQAGVKVTRLLERGGSVVGVDTTDGSKECGTVVVAAGAWTPQLVPELRPMVWPVGQPVLHFEARPLQAFQPPQFVTWAADIAATGWYGFPALDDGTLKIANHGRGRRLAPSGDAQVLPAEIQRFRGFLQESLPDLARAPQIGSRVCFYADSWDGDFYIDRVPERPGLVVASGGSGHGFKFAPVLGGIIADAVEGVESEESLRFGWRPAGGRTSEQARHM